MGRSSLLGQPDSRPGKFLLGEPDSSGGSGSIFNVSASSSFTLTGVGSRSLVAASYPADILATSGLASYYKLGETSGTVAADSKGSNPGTYTGGFTLGASAPTPLGASVTFNGSTGYVTVPDAASLRITTSITLEAWFKVAAVASSTWKRVVSKDKYALYINNANSMPTFYLSIGGILKSADGTSGTLSTGTWHHLVGTYNGSTLTLYLDGSSIATSAASGAIDTSSDVLFIGRDTSGSDFLSGQVCHAAVYGVALTSTQVAAHYSRGISALIAAAAATSFSVSTSCLQVADRVAAATTSFVASAAAAGFQVGDKPVSGISAFSIEADSSGHTPKTWLVSALTSLMVSIGNHTSGDRSVSGHSHIWFSVSCNGYVSPIPLFAVTSFTIATPATQLTVGDKPVFATTGMTVGASGAPFSRIYFVSASSEVDFSGSGSETKYSAFQVSAASRVTFSQVAAKSKYSAIQVSAHSGLLVSSPVLSRMDRVLFAASSFSLTTANARARDLFVSATTGLGLTASPDSNEFFYQSLTTSIICSASATAIITGTLASSGILFTDRAFATLEFPWRRAALTRIPGGNIPHS